MGPGCTTGARAAVTPAAMIARTPPDSAEQVQDGSRARRKDRSMPAARVTLPLELPHPGLFWPIMEEPRACRPAPGAAPRFETRFDTLGVALARQPIARQSARRPGASAAAARALPAAARVCLGQLHRC